MDQGRALVATYGVAQCTCLLVAVVADCNGSTWNGFPSAAVDDNDVDATMAPLIHSALLGFSLLLSQPRRQFLCSGHGNGTGVRLLPGPLVCFRSVIVTVPYLGCLGSSRCFLASFLLLQPPSPCLCFS